MGSTNHQHDASDFKELFRTICPSYVLPNRKTFSNAMLDKHYENLLGKVQNSLKNAKAVCLTYDGWKDLNNASFLAATAHFTHEGDCTLQSYC
uniref:DUF659 domain-containing protein n=1 Tax=Anopheles funestus TaxID=62324 RepID=A0A182RJX1_ANOFN